MRAAMLLILAVFALASPAAADVFTVRGVEVDETAETAAASRERAIAVGQLDAAERLLDRLTLSEDRVMAPSLDEASAARLVAGFQVEDEALAGARYIGRLTVTFDPGAVRDLLDSYHLPYVLSTARPMLVVPLWRADSQTELWDSNPWFDAWLVAGTADELVPVLAPSGDLRDISAIDAERARSLDTDALQRLASNYGARGVLVALARPTGGTGAVAAQMVAFDFDNGGARTDFQQIVAETPAELARLAASLLQEDWKRRMVVRDPSVSTVNVSALYNSLDGWMALQKVVGEEPLVELARLDALTDDGAMMTLEHRGARDQLALALRQHGVDLYDSAAGLVIAREGDAVAPVIGVPGARGSASPSSRLPSSGAPARLPQTTASAPTP